MTRLVGEKAPSVPDGRAAGAFAIPEPYRAYPLFIPAAATVVAFSPKSGCSHVALWAFLHQGLFEAANRHDPWPHKFRVHVYHRGAAFRRPLQALLRDGGAGRTLLRVTRDPRKRLVSIFRHACRFPFLAPQVRAVLGFSMREQGLSLADLDAVLGRLKLTHPTDANMHLRVQAHPLWQMDFDRVVTLNMDETPLDPGLNAFECDRGLPVTDFAALPAFAALRESHYAAEGDWPDDRPIETHRFRPEETATFPKRALMASPLLADMARRHYRADYAAGVASGDSAGRLFQPASAPVSARGPAAPSGAAADLVAT